MRLIALVVCWVLALGFVGCAQDEERRAAQEAGGTLPWNRPASWEGAGVMGAQFQGTR
jgi:hypothetical protein